MTKSIVAALAALAIAAGAGGVLAQGQKQPTLTRPVSPTVRPSPAPTMKLPVKLPPAAAPVAPDCGRTDCDGDGSASFEDGGADCDDFDRRRYPGAAEVADLDDLDEDCDPATYGRRDVDGDGYDDARACNYDRSNRRWNCGTDCNDQRRDVNPNVPEVCNGMDDNCDGGVDDTPRGLYFADSDGDGFGDPRASRPMCFPDASVSAKNTDCNDANALVHPGQFELANGTDDDCDGAVDEAPLIGTR
jgi:hypothetical protein